MLRKALLAAVLFATTPRTAQSQTFTFNRVSCVVNLIDACMQMEALFRPVASGTEFSIRLRVDQRTQDPTNQTRFSLNILSFQDLTQPDGLTVSNSTWLSSYGFVGRTSVPAALDWFSVGNAGALIVANTSRGLTGCGLGLGSPGLTTCADSGGLGALEINGFTTIQYTESIFSRILVSGFGVNAAGQFVGVGCAPSVLGLAQGLGAFVTPPQTESNSCFTREATESLAVGPYGILTTPEPRTATLVVTGLLLILVTERRRRSA